MADGLCRIGHGDVSGILPALVGFRENFDYLEHSHFESPPIADESSLTMISSSCLAAHKAQVWHRGFSAVAAALPALAAGLLWAPEAIAEQTFGDAGCDLADGESDIVVEVIDPVTIRLESGLVVRLAGIRPPEETSIAALAEAMLTGLALGEPATLRYGDLRRDRYQRATAHLYVAGAPEYWVQAELVAAGLAIVSGHAEDRSCIATLLSLERDARNEGAGLWRHRSPLDA